MIVNIIDWIFVFALLLPVLYLFVFAAFSMQRRREPYPPARKQRRFVTLIPAYKADAVIVRTAQTALAQTYPEELHRVAVIADRLQPETLAELRKLPLTVIEVAFENSSKAKALTAAVEELGPDAADAVAILDADNLVGGEFIARLNEVFDAGVEAVQAHRTAKNRDTDTAVLDAAGEEINNSIFRRGHVALGFSSALIGSGMAFRYDWFGANIRRCVTAGEDKELEALLLRQRIYIDYLDDVEVLDEKVQGEEAYYNQRRRWIAAQFYALGAAVKNLPGALFSGNFDYCDKICQWMLPPRLIQLAGVFGLTFVFTVIGLILSLCNGSNEWMIAIKWWILSAAQVAAMMLPVPGGRLFTKQVGKAITKMPMLAVTMIGNLFKLKGANKKFIHTEHGEHHK